MSDSGEDSDASQEELTSADIRRMFEAQKEQAEVEKEKQVTRRKELEYQKEQAERALETQLEDRDRQRDHENRIDRRNQRYGLVIITLLVIFFGYLVWLGETAMVTEIIRILIYGGAGWFAGNSVGKAQAGMNASDRNGQ